MQTGPQQATKEVKLGINMSNLAGRTAILQRTARSPEFRAPRSPHHSAEKTGPSGTIQQGSLRTSKARRHSHGWRIVRLRVRCGNQVHGGQTKSDCPSASDGEFRALEGWDQGGQRTKRPPRFVLHSAACFFWEHDAATSREKSGMSDSGVCTFGCTL
jgi:hypothetical protein